ncbi:MAG: DUF2155 domain-containing protein [Paracoccaceae bacterium]
MRILGLVVGLWASASFAQDASLSSGAVLRGLDKINGHHSDIEIPSGRVAQFGSLSIELTECRYPAGNPSGDAFAFLIIREVGKDAPVYRGWMIASSPALNPLDHARYDVWVMRCTTS